MDPIALNVGFFFFFFFFCVEEHKVVNFDYINKTVNKT